MSYLRHPQPAPSPSPRRCAAPTPSGPTDPSGPTPAPAADRPRAAHRPLVVGGGFTGLWAAIQAKEDDPSRDVVVSRPAAWPRGQGRNGGFVSPYLTHGLAQGVSCWPDELPTLERLGAENFAAIGATLTAYDIDADFHVPGELTLALTDHQVPNVREAFELHRAHGYDGRAARCRHGEGAG